jgi:hypothetical protein
MISSSYLWRERGVSSGQNPPSVFQKAQTKLTVASSFGELSPVQKCFAESGSSLEFDQQLARIKSQTTVAFQGRIIYNGRTYSCVQTHPFASYKQKYLA